MALYKWSTKLAGIWAWFNPTNLWTPNQLLKRNSNWYGWDDVNEVPSWWTEWQVLTKWENGYWWDDPSWWWLWNLTLLWTINYSWTRTMSKDLSNYSAIISVARNWDNSNMSTSIIPTIAILTDWNWHNFNQYVDGSYYWIKLTWSSLSNVTISTDYSANINYDIYWIS